MAEIYPLYDVIRGSKMSKNHLFRPKSVIFQPILTKLAKNVENGKTQILVYFYRNNEKFLSPSEARRRKKFRIHLSCVCVYPFLQGEDLSFVQKKGLFGPSQNGSNDFLSTLHTPVFGSEKFCFGVFEFLKSVHLA